MVDDHTDRRSVLGIGAMVASASVIASPARGRASAVLETWRARAEEQDAWMHRPGTLHRFLFDVTAAGAAASAMSYADTFYSINESGYGITPEALGVIIVLRRFSTPFGYGDAIWAKYGNIFAERLKLEGEAARAAAGGNPLMSAPHGDASKITSVGKDVASVTLRSVAGRGARFAVCGVATHGTAAHIAKARGVNAKAVEDELKANLIPGGVNVPAGIVAVNRAQEHGYAFVNIGD